MLRWPIGTASTWRWIRTKTHSGLRTSAFPPTFGAAFDRRRPQAVQAGLFPVIALEALPEPPGTAMERNDETRRDLGLLCGRRARDRLSRALCLCDVQRPSDRAGRPHPDLPQAGCAELFVRFSRAGTAPVFTPARSPAPAPARAARCCRARDIPPACARARRPDLVRRWSAFRPRR